MAIVDEDELSMFDRARVDRVYCGVDIGRKSDAFVITMSIRHGAWGDLARAELARREALEA